MNVWDACDGPRQIAYVRGTLYRLVESQEQIATLGYVDTLEEQALLEQMLEQVKPPYRQLSDDVHYLLKTPFRYPPLPWGSRFGQRHEPSIFYGGRAISTTLAESAYYRLVFWHSMEPHPEKRSIDSAHTLFSVGYRSKVGIRLQNPPFSAYAAVLTHPSNYVQTQQLGSAMREAGIQAFEYVSARDLNKGQCVGLFTPEALSQKTPATMSQWLCETSARGVIFKPLSQNTVYQFRREQFLVDGELPLPA